MDYQLRGRNMGILEGPSQLCDLEPSPKYTVCQCGIHRLRSEVEAGRACRVCGRTESEEVQS